MLKTRHRVIVGAIAFLLVGGGLIVLTDLMRGPGFPELTVEALETQPVFTDLAKNHRRLLRQARKEGKFSERPGRIQWAADIYEGIEAARSQDKPIFLVTFCRENCDQTRDV